MTLAFQDASGKEDTQTKLNLLPKCSCLLEKNTITMPDYKYDHDRRLFEAYAIGPTRPSQYNPCSDDPKEIGNWPRRLLHVPSMTSYTWQPGNIYGRYQEPEYNAISYTWGRFCLTRNENGSGAEGSSSSKQAIAVANVDWDIPEINPEHFSIEQFHTAIRAATKRLHERVDGKNTEFLWLDIACIDQRWGSTDGALEIGRQAAIFQGADEVYIWLSRSVSAMLEESIKDISAHLTSTWISP